MGGRAAYTLATALFVGGVGYFGGFTLLFRWLPEAAMFPILVFVGAARESVNRQLQQWRKEGILDLQLGRILLQNMTKLTAVARNE